MQWNNESSSKEISMRVKRALLFLLTILIGTSISYGAGKQTSAKHLQIVTKIAPLRSAKTPADNDLKAYLLVYFKDETHSIYFATSVDGYTFTDVNGGEPILLGRDVAEQKGVRDPHIMRGPDNAFYLSMTDLNIFGQRDGARTTEWERPAEQYSWGNNRALIFMKSYDLIHWTHAIVRIDRLFPSFADIGCAWAPETIVDPSNNKLMVYFTTRLKAGPNFMVYSYANNAFTTLESTPKTLFVYPKGNVNTIDGDITRVGDKYHLFYVAHEAPGNIRHAASDKINEGYIYEAQKVDHESAAAEAPNLWLRNGTNTYVLMYDVFGAHPHNMGFSETTDFIHYKNLGRFNEDGSLMKATNFAGPKHGAVMSITAGELQRLRGYFDKK
jgi:hypothetical protein